EGAGAGRWPGRRTALREPGPSRLARPRRGRGGRRCSPCSRGPPGLPTTGLNPPTPRGPATCTPTPATPRCPARSITPSPPPHPHHVVQRVPQRPVHLGRAPDRIRVLDQVLALAMRSHDLAALQQLSEVRRRRALARVWAQRLEPVIERPVRTQDGLDGHGRG